MTTLSPGYWKQFKFAVYYWIILQHNHKFPLPLFSPATESYSTFSSSIPKSVQSCSRYISYSTNESGSNRRCTLSLAVSLPCRKNEVSSHLNLHHEHYITNRRLDGDNLSFPCSSCSLFPSFTSSTLPPLSIPSSHILLFISFPSPSHLNYSYIIPILSLPFFFLSSLFFAHPLSPPQSSHSSPK